MKKLSALGLILILIFCFWGCGRDITLNSRENDLVAEYIAGTMLKYSKDNMWNYQQLEDEKIQDETESSGNSGNGQGNSENNGNSEQSGTESDSGSTVPEGEVMEVLAKSLNLSGAEVKYSSYKSGDYYSPDGLFSVPANRDCKVFAFEFEIHNTTSDNIVVNTTSSAVRFKLKIGDKTVIQSSSILVNDINNLKELSIASGDSYTAVVIFQVEDALVSAASKMELVVYSNGKEIGKVPGI